MEKKQFCLEQLAPYFKNPKLCGYSQTSEVCKYSGDNGTMCVFGKNLVEILPEYEGYSADELLFQYGQDLLKPEVREILIPKEWALLQSIHDSIASKYPASIEENIKNLGLFTYKELIEFSQNIQE